VVRPPPGNLGVRRRPCSPDTMAGVSRGRRNTSASRTFRLASIRAGALLGTLEPGRPGSGLGRIGHAAPACRAVVIGGADGAAAHPGGDRFPDRMVG
jgi:hypothetical protein